MITYNNQNHLYFFLFLIIFLTFFSDCTTPFQVSVVTDATQDAIAATIASSNKGKIHKVNFEPYWLQVKKFKAVKLLGSPNS